MGTIRTSIQIYDGMTPAIRNMINATNIMISGFERMNTASGNCINTAEISAARSELAAAEASFIQIDNAIDRARKSQDNFNNSMSSGVATTNILKSAITKVGAVLGVKKIINVADQFVQARGRLDLMNDGLQTTDELQNKIYQSAQRARAAYGDTVSVVSKLGILAGKAFSSNDEMIAFTELMNKNFIIGGSAQIEQSSAMYQLTQAMAAGKLQGDEYRSIIENAPLLAKSIEDYMINVKKVKGTMKDWAADGMLTAEVIKNALFNSAEETEKRFQKMPMTWGQVLTMTLNKISMIAEPLLSAISFVAQHASTLEPIFWGLVTAVGAYALITGIQTAKTWLAVAANRALITTMLQNPYVWIALSIGVLIAVIYKWVQSVGGAKIAWLIFKDKVLGGCEAMKLEAHAFKNGFLDALGALKVSGLRILDAFINAAIIEINKLIGLVNKIPGVAITPISHISNKANEAALELAEKSNARSSELRIAQMENRMRQVNRQKEIEKARFESSKAESGYDYSSLASNIESIAGDTDSMKNSLDITEEDLKYLRDIASQEAINRFTTAEIKVDFQNTATINSNMDIDGVMDTFTEKLREAIDTSAEGVPQSV